MTTSHTYPVTEFLEQPHGRLAYDVRGDGPLVVASPGIGDRRQSFRVLADDLAAGGFRVATVDLRGHGESTTGWPTYSETAVADDLLAILEHLRDGHPAALVGNSYSGGGAVVAAARRPDLVAAVVLLGAFVRTISQNLGQRTALWLISHTSLGRPLWNAYFPSLYRHKPNDFDSYRAATKAMLAEPGRFPAVAAMADADHDAAEAALPAVRAASLVVMGTADPDFPDPASEAERTAVTIGGPAEILMVDDAGHYPHAEHPEEVSPAVRAFLKRTLPRTGQLPAHIVARS